jgi:hypothetical protein
MKKHIFFLLWLVLLISCEKSDDRINGLATLSASDYDLYQMFFMPLSSRNIIVSETDTNLNCKDAENLLADTLFITIDAINSCVELNNKAYFIDVSEMFSGGLTFISHETYVNATSIAA